MGSVVLESFQISECFLLLLLLPRKYPEQVCLSPLCLIQICMTTLLVCSANCWLEQGTGHMSNPRTAKMWHAGAGDMAFCQCSRTETFVKMCGCKQLSVLSVFFSPMTFMWASYECGCSSQQESAFASNFSPTADRTSKALQWKEYRSRRCTCSNKKKRLCPQLEYEVVFHISYFSHWSRSKFESLMGFSNVTP